MAKETYLGRTDSVRIAKGGSRCRSRVDAYLNNQGEQINLCVIRVEEELHGIRVLLHAGNPASTKK